ncbi:MAG: patatin-like phospholipase family protein [Myxococcota bacterium]
MSEVVGGAVSGANKGPRLGLCLAGGGITGAVYEVGVLAALEDAFEDFSADQFDVIIGASTGACVATALAGGISAQRMYRALLDPSDDFFPLRRQHLMRIDLGELRRVWSSSIGAIRRLAGSVAGRPLSRDAWREVDRLWDSLPAGVFTMDPFEQFFFEFLTRRGLPKRFAEMPRQLMLVANDLDVGERIVFGVGGDLDHVPIAKAVAASMAVPMLYAPVRLDGRDFIAGGPGEAGHVDVAVEQGCELIVVINAMVPVRTDRDGLSVPTGHGPRKRVRDKGLLWVYNQSWRLLTEARLQKGLAAYRAEHPDIDVQLVEPARDDATMFMHSPMNFDARRLILEDGYAATRQSLLNPDSPLRKAFEAVGHTPRPAESAPAS